VDHPRGVAVTVMAGFLDSIGYAGWILHVLLVLPVIGAIATILDGEAGPSAPRSSFSAVEMVLSLGLWWAVDTSSGTLQMVYRTPWLARWGISYAVGIDGITLFMVLLSTILTFLSVLGSWNYIEKQLRGFYALLLLSHRHAGRVPVARSLPLLRDVGSDAASRCTSSSGSGAGDDALRGDQVLHLHHDRIAAHAGRDPRHGLRGGAPDRPARLQL
jgi:hypothetical protein